MLRIGNHLPERLIRTDFKIEERCAVQKLIRLGHGEMGCSQPLVGVTTNKQTTEAFLLRMAGGKSITQAWGITKRKDKNPVTVRRDPLLVKEKSGIVFLDDIMHHPTCS